MRDRTCKLLELLIKFRDNGYIFTTIEAFAERKVKKEKIVILRHDIDTDKEYAFKLAQFEKELGITGTYYFRLNTWDDKIIENLSENDFEVSYHYEEIATYIKKNKIKNSLDVFTNMQEIRDECFKNIVNIRKRSGLPIKTVASHGDFINRKIGITNTLIFKSSEFRKQCNIICEAYDYIIEGNLDIRLADRRYPELWDKNIDEKILKENKSIILILIHPRQWRSNIICNFNEDIKRLIEEMKYYL